MTNGRETFISGDETVAADDADDNLPSAAAAMLPPPPSPPPANSSSNENTNSTLTTKNFKNEKRKKEKENSSSSWMTGKTKASLISLAVVIVVLIFATIFFSNSNSRSKKQLSEDESVNLQRREFLRNMTREAWNALMMAAKTSNDKNSTTTTTSSSKNNNKHQSQAIVAALSTLHLMQLTEEFAEGRAWIAANLSGSLQQIEEFEVKVLLGDLLGGLLSCFALTKDSLFKEKSLEVLAILEPAFRSPTGLLYSHLNSRTKKPFGRRTALSWIGHQQPELLVAISLLFSEESSSAAAAVNNNNQKKLLQERLQKIDRFVTSGQKLTTVRGLYMHIVDVESGAWLHQIATLGSRAIDFYYNLLRAYLLQPTGNGNDHAHLMTTFSEAMEAVIRAGMLRKSSEGLTYALEYNLASESYAKAMATSACRLGGMLALASTTTSALKTDHQSSSNLTSKRMLELATSLTETCYWTANRTATGLLPLELWITSSSSSSSPALGSFNGFYELAESYLHLWRVTGDARYREYGWELATALRRHARTGGGEYAAVKDVNSVSPTVLNGDHRSVHFLAATFKYLFLLFSSDDDDVLLPKDRWIFNAFGQPLPVIL